MCLPVTVSSGCCKYLSAASTLSAKQTEYGCAALTLTLILCAAVSARQAHLPTGGMLVSVDMVLP